MSEIQLTAESQGGFAYMKDFIDPNFDVNTYFKVTATDLEIKKNAEIINYHAHVYYTLETKEHAKILYQRIAERFPVQLGMMYDFAAGPHKYPQFEAAFHVAEFPSFIPWLLLNHIGLSILVHTNTHFPRDDHLKTCFWIGKQLPLHGEKIPELLSLVTENPPPAIYVNTVPTIMDI